MSASSARTALRSALFSRLSADAVLSGLMGMGRIFEVPPRGQAFPFLLLESESARPLLTTAEEGLIHELRLAVYDRGVCAELVQQITAQVTELIMATPLSLTGHTLVGLQVQEGGSALMPDGRTIRGVLALRAVTEPVT